VPTGDAFVRQVRDALENLHDLPYLQTHPLAARAGAPAPSGRALRRALEEVLGALGTGRIPELLRLRYVEALAPPAVWRRLGVGKSEYHRSHGRGVAAVAQLLAERWAADETGLGAEPRPPAGARGNLPAELSSFVGRGREIAAVERLLDDARLVTLTGAPGAGKSRLALAVAPLAGARLSCPDGVWFVPLAPLAEPGQVLDAVGRALGLRDALGRTPAEYLAEYLREKRLLLVLDNCEHLIDAAPAIAALLRAAPALRVLATSRSALRVAGEHEFPVAGLPRDEAARLFVERARAAQPGFGPTGQDAAVVAEICHRLDGLPLAIELAAARSKVLAPSAMLARLESRLALLTAGARAGDDPSTMRHRTLRAAIDWSHDLLDAREKRVFRHLAVFVGGFTLEAAEALVGADALDGVDALLARSLLQRGAAGREARFSMLETIREYARERLEEQPDEAAAARAAHTAYFVALAERASTEWAGPDQPLWFARLEAEDANLWAALGAYAARADQAPGTPLSRAPGLPWGPGKGVSAWLQGLPPAARGDPRRSLEQTRALALSTQRRAASDDAEAAQALSVLEAAVGAARAAGDARELAASLRQLAVAHLARGAAAAARRLCDECVALGPRVGDRWEVAWDVHLRAVAAFDDADLAAARAGFEEALGLARAWGSPFLLARALEWLGNLALEQGDALAAAGHYEGALLAFREAGAPGGVSQSLLGLGIVALEQGDLPRAGQLLEESLVMQRENGMRQGALLTLEGLAGVAAGTPAGAERALRLAGAASAAHTRPGLWRVWPASQLARDRLERWLRPARQALTAAAAEAAWAAGRATPLEDAIAGALDDRAGAPRIGVSAPPPSPLPLGEG
jgi:predicted ATPase/Tfp pilus assembly protein PilF